MKNYRTPSLVINLKNYAEIYSNYSLDISKISESVANETSVEIIVCPPNPVLSKIIDNVNIPIYAQHVDDSKIGSSTGSIVPELLKSINCPGSLINHSEKRNSRSSRLHLERSSVCSTNRGLQSARSKITKEEFGDQPQT